MQRDTKDVLLDSREGIEAVISFAKEGGYVLSGYHERLSKKYGVETSGVVYSRPLPVGLSTNYISVFR